MHVLFVSSEVAPFSKTGGLADVVAALPKALRTLGINVSVLSPCYRAVRESGLTLARSLTTVKVKLAQKVVTAELLSHTGRDGVRQFFLNVPELYDRDGIYGERGDDFPDNPLRFALLSKAALMLCTQLDIAVDVIHVHDWPTGLLPFYKRHAKDLAGQLGRVATVLTIHNLAYQGLAPLEVASSLGILKKHLTDKELEFYGKLNPLKAGLLYADALTTVSPTYADEICTPEMGAGLEGVLAERRQDLTGILNGVDYTLWSPERDTHLPAHYNVSDLNGKRFCKAALQARFTLNIRPRTPLVGMVTRLVEQKGIDLVVDGVRGLLEKQAIQLVVVGRGEHRFHEALGALHREHPRSVAIALEHNEDAAHLAYAASDLFLMPSRYEPCGLSQLYAMRYGAIPVVHDTGGLHDTVVPYDPVSGDGTGFRFAPHSPDALAAALEQGVETFHQMRRWRQLMTTAMAMDFSWRRAAEQYVHVYRRAVEKIGD